MGVRRCESRARARVVSAPIDRPIAPPGTVRYERPCCFTAGCGAAGADRPTSGRAGSGSGQAAGAVWIGASAAIDRCGSIGQAARAAGRWRWRLRRTWRRWGRGLALTPARPPRRTRIQGAGASAAAGDDGGRVWWVRACFLSRKARSSRGRRRPAAGRSLAGAPTVNVRDPATGPAARGNRCRAPTRPRRRSRSSGDPTTP